jgi:hypothetical protein
MTFQQLRLLPALLKAKLGTVELESEIQGETTKFEHGDVVEYRCFLRVGREVVGNDKMDKFADWIDDPTRDLTASIVPFSGELVRKLTQEEFADMKRAELLVWQRENQRPQAV